MGRRLELPAHHRADQSPADAARGRPPAPRRRLAARLTAIPARPVLVFDGDCGFCTTCARFLHRWVVRDRPVSVAPWQRLDLKALGLTADQCRTAVQWVGRDGQVSSGHAAIAATLCAGHPVWRPLGTLLTAPGFAWLAARLYSWISAHRHALPGGTPACRPDPQ